MSVSVVSRNGADLGDPEVVAEIRRVLDGIGDPCSAGNGTPMGIEEMGLVEAVEVDPDGHAVIRLRLTSPTCHMVAYFKVEAEERAMQIPGVRSVRALSDIGLDWTPAMMSEGAKARRRLHLQSRGIESLV
jgi:metal-sulfur cluster biosynthetic enzyme